MAESIIVLGIGAGDSIFSLLTGGLNQNVVNVIAGQGNQVYSDLRPTIRTNLRPTIEPDKRKSIKV